VPGLPLGCPRRSAWAPNDIRRVKGVAGLLREGPSSSSMAFSSIESEPAVETLPRRALRGKVVVGEAPDRPRVDMDMRLRWS
jgi:hypothetical protein